MNTDDNEQRFAQLAMMKPGERLKHTSGNNRFVRYVEKPVKRVKGFDHNAQLAERRKAKRAKQYQKRLQKAVH